MSAPFSQDELALVSGLIETGVASSRDRLARLSKTPWETCSISVAVVPIPKVLALLEKSEDETIGVCLRSGQHFPVEFLMLFPSWSAVPLADIVTQGYARMQDLPDRENAVVSEVANIVCQGILKAMADQFGIAIILSAPELKVGNQGGLAADALRKFDDAKVTVVLTRVEMHSDSLPAVCSILIILDAEALRRRLVKAS
jgi:chemotaxis protein CheY-P-specific phosphatase CheC